MSAGRSSRSPGNYSALSHEGVVSRSGGKISKYIRSNMNGRGRRISIL